MRSAAFVVGLAWKRLTRRGSGALLAAAGLAIATSALAGVLAGVTIATDRATAAAIERIPTDERSVRAAWFGVPGDGEQLGALDRHVEEAFGGLGLDAPTPLVLFRESTVAGRFVGISAVDGVAEHVLLRSGRMPRACTRSRCEVLRLRGTGALPNTAGLRLVEVGRATLRSRQLYGDFLQPAGAATAEASLAPVLRQSSEYHRPPPAPLVVAEGRASLAAAAPLARTYRTYAWVWPVDPGSPRLWEVNDFVTKTERARVELAERSSSFAVDAPVEELRAVQQEADVAGTRLLLVGGEGAALLLAFTVLAARGMRRDLEAARRRLTWAGAQRWQLVLLSAVESAGVAVVGIAVGWVAGIGVAALASHLAGAPAADVLRESVLSLGGIALVAACAVAAALVVWLTVSAPARIAGRLGVLDVVAVVAVVVAAVVLASGGADTDRLRTDDGVALLLLLVPGLVVVAAAILVARTLPSLSQWWANRGRRSLSARLAAVGLARGPGAAVATAGFLTIAFAVALLAEGYRATLSRADREQAAFAVPHEIVVREDLQNLVRVFDAAPLARYQELADRGGAARPILRVRASAGRAERVSSVSVLGLDAAALECAGVWRDEWASGRDREALAELVEPGRSMEMGGVELGDGRIELSTGPGLVSLAAVVRSKDGAFRRIELGAARPREATTLTAKAPAGSMLVGLEIVPPPRLVEGGADAGVAFFADVRISAPLAEQLRDWRSFGGASVRPLEGGVRVRVPLTLVRASGIRATQPTDSEPPEVLVTPRLAELAGGVGGTLPLRVGGGDIPVRVAGVVDRFPGTEGETVVGNRLALRTAINSAAPGAARENEVWLDVPRERVPSVAAALAQPPFRVLETTARKDVEGALRDDPLARGTLLALAGVAAIALLLAALGLALAVRVDLRDERGEHFDLEAQGASPAFLRRVVRARAATVSAVGLVGGLLTGVLLLSVVTRVVTVTASGGAPEPPLAVVFDPALVVLGLAVFVALAGLLVGLATRRAFSGARGPEYRETA